MTENETGLDKDDFIRKYLAQAGGADQISELSAERLNLYLQHAENEAIPESGVEGFPGFSTDSPAKREVLTKKQKWKQEFLLRARIALPHIGLVLLSALYTVLGGVMFWCIEQPHEINVTNTTVNRLFELQDNFKDLLWQMAKSDNVSEEVWKETADEKMMEILKKVHWSFTRDYLTPANLDRNDLGQHDVKWTFAASIFFSWTAITTIGYGHIVPRTVGGRIACLVYALFGIPLILVTIADMGRFLSSGIIFIHQTSRRCSAWLCKSCARCCMWCLCCSKRYKLAKNSQPPSEQLNKPFKKRKKHAGGESSPEKSGTFDEISEIDSRTHTSPVKQNGSQADTQSPFDFIEAEAENMEAERRVSVTFVLIILVGYTAAGACLMRLWEYWSFFDAFYYCFVTVTTIGFGDIVPQQESFLWATLAYIVLGLIITTMCIDLVGSEYIRDIHFYGRNIGRLTHQALITFGGKVIHLGEVFGYVAFLQRNFGITADQLDKLANLPDNYLLDCMIHGRQPNVNWLSTKPFIPYDIFYYKWIEQPRTLSYASEKVMASMESLDMTSRCSTARTPREYYQHIMMQYCKDNDTTRL